jgi:EmrB/QacA subfamily drug resistance transporter
MITGEAGSQKAPHISMNAAPSSTALNPRERWIATGSLLLGMVAFTIAIMVANVVLPQIMSSLRVDLDQAQWVLTAHGMAQTVVMPMVGWITSLIGHRRLFLGSLTLFCISATLSGMAWSLEALVVFQILGGIGVGLMQPIIMAIMYQIFPPNQRGLALGLSMIGWSFGPAIAPIAGGYLVEWFSWRAAFYLSVPLGLAGLACAFLYLPHLPRPARKAIDQMGLLTMSVGLLSLLMALGQGRREGWDSSYIVTLLLIATVALTVFLVWEWRSVSPLVDLRLFRCVPFTLACLVVFISTCVFRGTGVLTIVFMQRVLDFTPLHVGWLMLAGNIAYGVAVVMAGRLADLIEPNILVIAGLGIFALGFFWFAGVNETVTAGILIILLSLRLTSFGVMGSPNNLSAMRALPEEQVVMATGLFSLVRSISGTMGPVISVAFYEHRFVSHMQHYAANNTLTPLGFEEAATAVRSLLHWSGEIPALLSVKASALLQQRLLAEATMAAYQDYFFVSALIGMAAMLPALPWIQGWHGVSTIFKYRRSAPLPMDDTTERIISPLPLKNPEDTAETTDVLAKPRAVQSKHM